MATRAITLRFLQAFHMFSKWEKKEFGERMGCHILHIRKMPHFQAEKSMKIAIACLFSEMEKATWTWWSGHWLCSNEHHPPQSLKLSRVTQAFSTIRKAASQVCIRDEVQKETFRPSVQFQIGAQEHGRSWSAVLGFNCSFKGPRPWFVGETSGGPCLSACLNTQFKAVLWEVN